MFLLILVCLNILHRITSEQVNPNHPECRDIPKGNIVNMCKNPTCVKNVSVAFFCQHVYEKIFQCQSKYLPLRFICDGIRHCQNGIDEDPVVCSYIACEKNFYKCQQGNYCIDLAKLCNGINDCQDGFDESPLVCRRLIDYKNISCPIIFEETHAVTCHVRYGNLPSVISCDGLLPPETKAEVTCKPFFNSRNLHNFQTMTCQHNGTWDKDIIKCEPECGIVSDTKISPLILNGITVTPATWPWHCALFQLVNGKWTFFCSSTIISSNIVITAAHCVWEMPKTNIKATAGKRFSNFYTQEPYSQTADIQSIFMHPLYHDSLGNYGSDIAIIKLKSPFSYTEFVLPVCMNWSLRNIIREMNNNVKGKVVGLGITENGTISNELRSLEVQILTTKECLHNQIYEFRKYITIGSFCAKGINDGVLCNGDSGSGLAIKSKESGKWVLEGIVSISPKNPNDILCDKKYYSIYTNVGIYSNWIYEYFSKN